MKKKASMEDLIKRSMKDGERFRSRTSRDADTKRANAVSILKDVKQQMVEAETPRLPAVKNAVVRAYAGTGKTFTEVVGTAYAYGSRALWGRMKEHMGFEPVPSAEQKAVWETMKEMVPRTKGMTIVYCAFNKSIVTDFSMKWAWLVELLKRDHVNLSFSTINSLGYKTCQNYFGRQTRQGCKYKTSDILSEVLGGRDIRELRKQEPVMVNAVEKLVGLSKLTLIGWASKEDGAEIPGFSANTIADEDLFNLCRHHDIDLEDPRMVFETVVEVLKRSYDMTWKLDFDDQNWMPVTKNLPIDVADLLLVDEAQDLPRVRQEFAVRAGNALLVVGDVYQAIYGFAGADVDSIPRMEQMLGVTEPLRLTQTRRCGKAIVELARTLVPDFTAHESNPPGEVLTENAEKYTEMLKDGDGVLCRINAPLVSHALKRLKERKKAVIIGRKFGESLFTFVKGFKVDDVGDLVQAVDDWYHSEVAKEMRTKNPSEDRLIALEDKKDCVLAFTEGCSTADDVVACINRVFAGRVCPLCGQHYDDDVDRCYGKQCQVEETIGADGKMYPAGKLLVIPEGVQYSSVHRAKGREWDNVFILYPELIPHPMAKTPQAKGQEKNLQYVAYTRAIHRLVLVPRPAKRS